MGTFLLWAQLMAYLLMLLGGVLMIAVAVDGLHHLLTGQLHLLSQASDLPDDMKDLA